MKNNTTTCIPTANISNEVSKKKQFVCNKYARFLYLSCQSKGCNDVQTSLITENVYRFTAGRMFEVKNEESWRGKKPANGTFFKEDKEALNAMIYFILLLIRKAKYHVSYNINACIAFLYIRFVRKALTWDGKPENVEDLRNKAKGYDECINGYVYNEIATNTSKEFADFIFELANKISPEEKELFSVAKNKASLIEKKQIMPALFKDDKHNINKRLRRDAKKHQTHRFFDRKLTKLLCRISWSRNIVRWQSYATPVRCNILCHMYETAFFAWLMAIEENMIANRIVFLPEEVFKVALFHDISEPWTDDVPSPCKDQIKIGGTGQTLRPILEQQEREALEENFYSAFNDPEVAKYFKKNIMLEEIKDEKFHKFIKRADYFSADCEVYWNLMCGVKYARFPQILEESLASGKRTPSQVKLINGWLCKIKNNEFLET